MTRTYTLFSKADFVARQVLSAFPNVSTLRQDLTLSIPPEWPPRDDCGLEATVYFSFQDDDNLVCFPVPFPVHVPPSSYDDEDLFRR
jgi:hypothetical protein